jgi:hypothetical protein
MNPTTYSKIRGAVVKAAVVAAVAFSSYFIPSTALALPCSAKVVAGKQKPPSSSIVYKTEGKGKKKKNTDEIKTVTLTFPVDKGKVKRTLSVTMPGPLFEGAKGDKVDGLLYANATVAVDKYLMPSKRASWTWKCAETPDNVPGADGWEIPSDTGTSPGANGVGKTTSPGTPTEKPAPVERAGNWRAITVRKKVAPQFEIGAIDSTGRKVPLPVGESGIGVLFKARKPDINGLYDRALKQNPSLSGKITVQLDVGSDGYVKKVLFKGDGVNEELVRMYAGYFSRARFAGSQGGFKVEFPLVFVKRD